LKKAGPVPFEAAASTYRVVLEFEDAPNSVPHAMTFTMSSDGATVDAGDHLMADALLRLNFSDATALSAGAFDSSTAIREGRVKVRGDINKIVPLLSWLQASHPLSQ
jgi:ubiquinone biosynthesis protein UbiJ